MESHSSRSSLAALGAKQWDLLVIGGGLTGAAIMREAARRGLRVLLVEQRDFAEGTSSRSSKLIHGGLHYLARGQFGLSRTLVHERERLLRTMAGLIEPLEFVLPLYAGEGARRWGVGAGLGLYEAFAGRPPLPRRLDRASLDRWLPGMAPGAIGAFCYAEGVVDDARLVIRLLHDGRRFGGHALNYVMASALLRDRAGRVAGAVLRDCDQGIDVELRSRAVVNATGPWSDGLRAGLGKAGRVRLVRGAHLVFAGDRLPIDRAVAVRHPDSGEPLYAVPWEGVTVIGSTSIDETAPTADDPRTSRAELDYLLGGARSLFPALDLREADIRATFAGERPLIDRSTASAAMASRDYAVWEEAGLLTVVGGKLTTFQLTADRVLQRLWPLPLRPAAPYGNDASAPRDDLPFDRATACRLHARYGAAGLDAIAHLPASERSSIPGQRALWGELRWAARAEDSHHLTDLLLRRVRLGLVAPDGALPLLDAIRPLVQGELGWDDARWTDEAHAYACHWRRAHGIPS